MDPVTSTWLCPPLSDSIGLWPIYNGDACTDFSLASSYPSPRCSLKMSVWLSEGMLLKYLCIADSIKKKTKKKTRNKLFWYTVKMQLEWKAEKDLKRLTKSSFQRPSHVISVSYSWKTVNFNLGKNFISALRSSHSLSFQGVPSKFCLLLFYVLKIS